MKMGLQCNYCVASSCVERARGVRVVAAVCAGAIHPLCRYLEEALEAVGEVGIVDVVGGEVAEEGVERVPDHAAGLGFPDTCSPCLRRCTLGEYSGDLFEMRVYVRVCVCVRACVCVCACVCASAWSVRVRACVPERR